MKAILLTATIAALAGSALADTDITREEVAALKNLDPDSLAAKADALEGQIVRIKFNYRSPQITQNPDGTKSGILSIWRSDSRAGKKSYLSGHMKVTIPPEAMDWFQRIPLNDMTHQSYSVLVRVGKSTPVEPAGELLGREIKTDTKGSHIVW